MSKIKICGLKTLADIQAVNKHKPDYIGFVFAESKRRIDIITAKELKEELSSDIQAVGVFVNAPITFIQKICEEKLIDIIQLHGDEDPAYISELKKKVSNSIIKAIRVQSREQLLSMRSFPSDYLLLDTYQSSQYGGSGISFDRSLIPKNISDFFLAGGLNLYNIREAILDCKPYCVDISSGVESDGRKDEKKIQQVIATVRSL